MEFFRFYFNDIFFTSLNKKRILKSKNSKFTKIYTLHIHQLPNLPTFSTFQNLEKKLKKYHHKLRNNQKNINKTLNTNPKKAQNQ